MRLLASWSADAEIAPSHFVVMDAWRPCSFAFVGVAHFFVYWFLPYAQVDGVVRPIQNDAVAVT
jgi:hypothetical protein